MKMNFNNIIKKALVKGYKLKNIVQNALKISICTIQVHRMTLTFELNLAS